MSFDNSSLHGIVVVLGYMIFYIAGNRDIDLYIQESVVLQQNNNIDTTLYVPISMLSHQNSNQRGVNGILKISKGTNIQ